MLISKNWTEYECLDIGDGYKIERFGDFIFKRPEPSAQGKLKLNHLEFDGYFKDKEWITKDLPDTWVINYENLKFELSPSSFKHLGLFPEQAVNWDFIMENGQRVYEPIRVLNLFAYTGAATIAAAKYNAEEVVHVDALKSSIKRVQTNIKLNNFEDVLIRTLVDDVIKFLEREKRRGRTYHAIIMDPPSFGRGPNREIWTIEDKLNELLDLSLDLLDENAQYLILNTYSTNLGHEEVLEKLVSKFKEKNIHHGYFDSNKLGVKVKHKDTLQLGNTTRWCIHEDLLRR